MPYQWLFALNQDGRHKGHKEIEITHSNLKIAVSEKYSTCSSSKLLHSQLSIAQVPVIHNKICIEPT